MITITKKDNAVPTQATMDLEKQLLKTAWVKESEQLLKYIGDDLTKTDKKILQKCVDKKDFTDKQVQQLKKVLVKYRTKLEELKPDETIEAVDNFVQMINTEKEFIKLMSADTHRKLYVNVKTFTGEIYGFNFEVLQVTDSRVVDSLELQIDLFRDYSMEDKATYLRASAGEELTPEEQLLVEKINQEIIEKQSTEKIKAVDNFLSHQLKIEGSNADFDERLEFWSLFPFNSKVGVFIRVQDMLGLTDVYNSELFPTRQ